jgi:hypothetical protein
VVSLKAKIEKLRKDWKKETDPILKKVIEIRAKAIKLALEKHEPKQKKS